MNPRLDNKIDAGLTKNADEYAKAINTVLQKHLISNPLYIESPKEETLNGYQQYIQRDFVAVLPYLAFLANENW